MKKATIPIVLSMLVCTIVAISCTPIDPDGHYKILFVNNSDNDVFVRADWWYPDTVITFGNPAKSENEFMVKAKSSNGHPLSKAYSSYEADFKLNDTFMVFVLDAELVKNTPWDTVKAKYLVLKRYDLSFNDLDSMNWTITYQ